MWIVAKLHKHLTRQTKTYSFREFDAESRSPFFKVTSFPRGGEDFGFFHRLTFSTSPMYSIGDSSIQLKLPPSRFAALLRSSTHCACVKTRTHRICWPSVSAYNRFTISPFCIHLFLSCARPNCSEARFFVSHYNFCRNAKCKSGHDF